MNGFGLTLGVLAWLVACWMCLAFLTVPVTLLAAGAGLLYGATLAVTGYLRIYRGVEDAAVLAVPRTDARGPRAPYPRWDGAWPNYLSGQVEDDIRAALGWPGRRAHQLVAKGREQAGEQASWILGAFPLAPAYFGFFAGVAIGSYAAWTVLAVGVEIVTVVPRGVRLGAVFTLRAVDTLVQWWRGAAATCPGCRYVAWRPAYACTTRECTVHRDLRPGRLGVWRRRCQCGTYLPTSVLRAARARLNKVCPNCGGRLHPGAGVVADARIVLSGGPAVGKTRLLARAVSEMKQYRPADRPTAVWLRAQPKLAEEGPRDGPGPAEEPGLLTFRQRRRGKPRHLHVADLDGKLFETGRDNRELWQLGTTRRHLLVLDPTLLPSVRDRMGSGGAERPDGPGQPGDYAWTELSVAQAELPYRLLVAQLNRLGARPRRCALALVVTKADCLAAHGLAPGQGGHETSSKTLREWLRTVELHNLVDVAEHDFARVRCFLVGDGQPGSAAPFEWLLRQYPRGAATA